MKFRKKPIEVDAWPIKEILRCAAGAWRDLPDEVARAYESGKFLFCPTELRVSTLEGMMIGGINDWLIMGVKGEFYPCKPDIFDQTYSILEVPF